MSRRHSAQKREVLPDPKFGDQVLSKLINTMMYSGKKSAAEAIAYGALEMIQKRTSQDPLKVFHDAIDNIKPSVEVRSRRVGGATYQVPMEVRPIRKLDLGIRWMISNARKRSGKSMQEKLAGEFLDASNNTGASVKKRDDTHRMAEANKAFAHYRF